MNKRYNINIIPIKLILTSNAVITNKYNADQIFGCSLKNKNKTFTYDIKRNKLNINFIL